MIWRILWGIPSVLSVLGAVTAAILVFLAGCLVLLYASGRRHARRQRGHKPSHEVPLFLLRAWTWRKRRRNSKHLVVPDWAGKPLSGNERAALERLEKEIH